MGMNPRYGNFSWQQWKDMASTVDQMLAMGWPVIARCRACDLEMDVRLARVKAAKGGAYVIWGKSVPCKRRHCPGRMSFWTYPPKSNGRVEMF